MKSKVWFGWETIMTSYSEVLGGASGNALLSWNLQFGFLNLK